jgi:hypothetical protein
VIYSIFSSCQDLTFMTSRDQLFFISFARIWARVMKPAAAVSFAEISHARSSIWRFYQVQRIRTDPHSPSRFRVDGTVSNIPEFAEVFKCSRKAKVSLWFSSDLVCFLTTLCDAVESPKRRPMCILVIVPILNLHRAIYINCLLFLPIEAKICLSSKVRH